MIDPNRKRYVYLDRYLEQQALIMKKLNSHDAKINILTVAVMGCIVVISFFLYKIFG